MDPKPTQLAAWKRIQGLTEEAAQEHLRHLLRDPDRARWTRVEAAGLQLDFSHQKVNPAILEQLTALADEAGVFERRASLFAGEPINTTEGRPALHPALRGQGQAHPPWGQHIQAEVDVELERCLTFASTVRARELLGWTDKPIDTVINLGIGGSDLGPRMVSEAMACSPAVRPLPQHPTVHYVSNPDGWALTHVLRQCAADRTLLIVQSKSFTTQETLTLFASVRRWFLDSGCPEECIDRHVAAVTANPLKAEAHGIARDKTFHFWEWVGGRYSVWSAIGLPAMISAGPEAFREFLAGGAAMDQHFQTAPPAQNIPLLLGLLGVWNRNFLRTPTHHIAAYAYGLQRFTAFIQQMDMESNGKRVHLDGSPIGVLTGPIVWGGLGIDGQHAYFQLLHQGTHPSSIDFIGVQSLGSPLPLGGDHDHVVAINFQAQQDALALGRTHAETLALLREQGMAEDDAVRLAPHRVFDGDVPSLAITMKQLTPQALGALVAAYEHKVFVQSVVWNINAYDQWGVELGKTMAKALEP